ncbi:hypothetical protein [Cellvibrio sp. UBA7661]|uniref:hypothetical protein n=1 Tax=Cellvibrio sp. UBA7661 TaxID=1946311 RepID=UPI002F3611D8
MEICFSRYNEPFTEPSTPEVHYISLDAQRDMKAGFFDAHVKEFYCHLPAPRLSKTFRTFRTDDLLEVFDPLSGVTRFHDVSNSTFFYSPAAPTSSGDLAFAHELHKAKVSVALTAASRCTCGNAKRPWRCTCNK